MVLYIPNTLRKKVIRCFGPAGERWLERLPYLLEKSIVKWQLCDVQVSDVISYNYVCFAKSPIYGDVALKIGVPDFELYTEMTALNLYHGCHICKCYDHDLELGAMLLERIRPGRDLTTVSKSHERIHAAAKLVSQLPKPITQQHDLPKWSELAQRTFGKLRARNSAGAEMLLIAQQAEEMINQLESSGRPLVLLHGDLNHWNILLDQNGGWKAIDPKGQVGVACMEAGRFILNELDIAAPIAPFALLEQMIDAFAKELHEPRHIIAQCVFIDKALSTGWKFEEHCIRDLTTDVKECLFLLEFLYQTTKLLD